MPFRQLLLDPGAVGQFVEISAGALILRVRPRFNVWILIVLQPLIRIIHFDSLIFIRHRLLRRLGSGLSASESDETKREKRDKRKWQTIDCHRDIQTRELARRSILFAGFLCNSGSSITNT